MVAVKRHDEATRLLGRIVAAQPENGRAWCLLATAHLGSGRYQDAADAAKQAVVAAPSDDWPYRLVSITQMHLGDVPVAMQAASEACPKAPNGWRAWLCMAQAALATEVDFDLAERAAAKARELAPYHFRYSRSVAVFGLAVMALISAVLAAVGIRAMPSAARWGSSRPECSYWHHGPSRPRAGASGDRLAQRESERQ
jgi:tetratricopeptide (TPR) repeat protein